MRPSGIARSSQAAHEPPGELFVLPMPHQPMNGAKIIRNGLLPPDRSRWDECKGWVSSGRSHTLLALVRSGTGTRTCGTLPTFQPANMIERALKLWSYQITPDAARSSLVRLGSMFEEPAARANVSSVYSRSLILNSLLNPLGPGVSR